MKNKKPEQKWSVQGAINTILDAPLPGGDTVFAPDLTTVNSARKFLEEQYSKKEISDMIQIGTQIRNGQFPIL